MVAIKEALWDRYFTGAPRPLTPSEQPSSDQASIQALSARYGVNPKTVAKWRKRTNLEDCSMGPKAPRSTVLSPDEEALIVAFRRQTQLPLDDCLYALQATVRI